MSRRTRVDDYYVEEDDYSPRNRQYTTKRRVQPMYYDTTEEDLEEAQRAMHNLGLEERNHFDPHNERSQDYVYSRDQRMYPMIDRRLQHPRRSHQRSVEFVEDGLPRRGSNTSLSSYRRAHSYSMPQPSHYMESPQVMPSPRYRRRSVHSMPVSPLQEHEEVYTRPEFVRRESGLNYDPIDRRQSFPSVPFPQPRTERPMYPSEYFDASQENRMYPQWPSMAHPYPNNPFHPPIPPVPIIPMVNPVIPPLWMPPHIWPNQPEVPPVNEPPEPNESIPPEPVPEEIKPTKRVIIPRRSSFLADLFGFGGSREMRREREYEKLGSFWCWRMIVPQQSMHFESFGLSNQKYIKKKIEKGEGSTIFLTKEKGLPGLVLLDVNQCRGCCMVRKDYYIQLEIKLEQYNPEGDQYVFGSSS